MVQMMPFFLSFAMLVISTLAFPTSNIPTLASPVLEHHHLIEARGIPTPDELKKLPMRTFGEKVHLMRRLEVYFRACENLNPHTQESNTGSKDTPCGSSVVQEMHELYISVYKSIEPHDQQDQGLDHNLDLPKRIKKESNLQHRLIRAALWMDWRKPKNIPALPQDSRARIIKEWNDLRDGALCDLAVLADSKSAHMLIDMPDAGPELDEVNRDLTRFRKAFDAITPSSPEWSKNCNSPLTWWIKEEEGRISKQQSTSTSKAKGPESKGIFAQLRRFINWIISWFKSSKGSSST